MNIINCLTKTIGILVLLNICLFLIPKPIKKLINIIFKGANKLLALLFEYIKNNGVDDKPKTSNVVQFKRKAK